LTPHFELNAQAAARRLLVEFVADLARAGEGDGPQRRVFEERVADRATAAGHVVDDPGRKARPLERLDETQRAQWRQRGRLEDHRIACDERRRQLPRRYRARKV